VPEAPFHVFTKAHLLGQVEYLVVVWTKDGERVLVSLRQADILKALASDKELTSGGGGVPDLQATTGARYVSCQRPASYLSRKRA
jgi:glutamate--cysteine ligase catalytic subunit